MRVQVCGVKKSAFYAQEFTMDSQEEHKIVRPKLCKNQVLAHVSS